MLLIGFRRMEVLALRYAWLRENAVTFPDTKTGPQTRAIRRAAIELIARQKADDDQMWVFPSERTEGHFVCVETTLRRACSLARIEGVPRRRHSQ